MSPRGSSLAGRGLAVLVAGLVAAVAYGIGTPAQAAPQVAGVRPAFDLVWWDLYGYREWPDLGRGSQGPKVEAVQLLLTDRGHAIEVDGHYGSETVRAVAAVQRAYGLVPSGFMTDRTFERLVPTVSRGDRGPEVQAVQLLLARTGQPIEVSGVFGLRTKRSVMGRQTEIGRPMDGVVGPQTWQILFWYDARLTGC